MKITTEQLAAIIKPTKYEQAQLEKITESIAQTFDRYDISTPLRACHFLAQVLHESSAFKFTVEIWGPTPAQRRYDTRVDLGNSPELDGDGFKFRGRGWIQLTGKTNYKLATTEFGQDFISDPSLIHDYPWAALVSGWFWKRKKLNDLADLDDITSITKKVNGGFNGFDDRKMWLAKSKAVLLNAV
ncbi:chitinase [Solitalea longa]|uniref:Chitinase n=1 Tax=Solitalea longa TaxID=2079460 RepID=A0A2S4ZWV6_9SPHI|nr:glycoside hydrolase family 19 protein [Solitalea longa]POY34850.1 chitinase [Solitalea longa]